MFWFTWYEMQVVHWDELLELHVIIGLSSEETVRILRNHDIIYISIIKISILKLIFLVSVGHIS